MKITWDTHLLGPLPPSGAWSNPNHRNGRFVDSVELRFGAKSYELSESIPENSSPRQYLYKLVYDLLKNGALSRLKLCRQCDRIFACASSKADFCSHDCRWKFNNEKRLHDGTFKQYRENNKKRRERRRLRAQK
jgi:hypothetical protein